MNIDKTQQCFVVEQLTDPALYTFNETTARRLSGNIGIVTTADAHHINGTWYAPVTMEEPNEADLHAERMDKRRKDRAEKGKKALAMAREKGLTDDHIRALQSVDIPNDAEVIS